MSSGLPQQFTSRGSFFGQQPSLRLPGSLRRVRAYDLLFTGETAHLLFAESRPALRPSSRIAGALFRGNPWRYRPVEGRPPSKPYQRMALAHYQMARSAAVQSSSAIPSTVAHRLSHLPGVSPRSHPWCYRWLRIRRGKIPAKRPLALRPSANVSEKYQTTSGRPLDPQSSLWRHFEDTPNLSSELQGRCWRFYFDRCRWLAGFLSGVIGGDPAEGEALFDPDAPLLDLTVPGADEELLDHLRGSLGNDDSSVIQPLYLPGEKEPLLVRYVLEHPYEVSQIILWVESFFAHRIHRPRLEELCRRELGRSLLPLASRRTLWGSAAQPSLALAGLGTAQGSLRLRLNHGGPYPTLEALRLQVPDSSPTLLEGFHALWGGTLQVREYYHDGTPARWLGFTEDPEAVLAFADFQWQHGSAPSGERGFRRLPLVKHLYELHSQDAENPQSPLHWEGMRTVVAWDPRPHEDKDTTATPPIVWGDPSELPSSGGEADFFFEQTRRRRAREARYWRRPRRQKKRKKKPSSA